ncbi:hypothetical protein H5410_008681 [Solanum commersonii]|uniref:Uncharacterized protein n=1 Tax=Solanum commersonii TaxID=4109 RepID=A0A9J6AHG3_SOLCO|nr:hypothetical protein H5410_008681 [Solanum commersonii]
MGIVLTEDKSNIRIWTKAHAAVPRERSEEIRVTQEQLLKMMQNSSSTQLTQIFNVLNENNQMMENPHKGFYMAEDELIPCVVFQPVVQNGIANRDAENTGPSSLIVNEHVDLSSCATTDQYSPDQNQVSSTQPAAVPSPTLNQEI